MSENETGEAQSQPEADSQGSLKQFKGKKDRAKERVWKTAFIICQDEEGHVVVDNSTGHFEDQIIRLATIDDAIYMLQTSLNEFKEDKAMARLQTAIKGAMTDGIQ